MLVYPSRDDNINCPLMRSRSQRRDETYGTHGDRGGDRGHGDSSEGSGLHFDCWRSLKLGNSECIERLENLVSRTRFLANVSCSCGGLMRGRKRAKWFGMRKGSLQIYAQSVTPGSPLHLSQVERS